MDYQLCFENPKEAAELIDRLYSDIQALHQQNAEWKRKAELPMKYKRLQHNAELQEQLASVTKEFDSAWNTASIYKQKRDELVEALEYILQYPEHTEVTARVALAKVGERND